MNKIDNFFKKKVEDAAMEPRAEAWAKLEANLSKKNKGLGWFRIAAAVLLAGMLVTSIMWLQNKEGEQQMAEESKKEIPSETPLDKSPEETTTQSTPGENKGIAKSNKTTKKEKNVSDQIPDSQLDKDPDPIVITTIPIEPETIQSETVTAAIVEKPIVIEYTLESVKYLKKEPVLAAVDKKNGLQKAIDFARDAKNSDSPLGEIRQAKDDLFALNFKKDKQKKQ